ncbi:hypothetical protein ACMDCR_30935 [Labrys okinawensis]|uniref:hypothetical protein n=1 Tax=Labrys okinawensis TaxID=346911 RepID=UPI0039BD7C22
MVGKNFGRWRVTRFGHAQPSNVVLVVQKPSQGNGMGDLIGMSFLARFDVMMAAGELSLKARNLP